MENADIEADVVANVRNEAERGAGNGAGNLTPRQVDIIKLIEADNKSLFKHINYNHFNISDINAR